MKNKAHFLSKYLIGLLVIQLGVLTFILLAQTGAPIATQSSKSTLVATHPTPSLVETPSKKDTPKTTEKVAAVKKGKQRKTGYLRLGDLKLLGNSDFRKLALVVNASILEDALGRTFQELQLKDEEIESCLKILAQEQVDLRIIQGVNPGISPEYQEIRTQAEEDLRRALGDAAASTVRMRQRNAALEVVLNNIQRSLSAAGLTITGEEISLIREEVPPDISDQLGSSVLPEPLIAAAGRVMNPMQISLLQSQQNEAKQAIVLANQRATLRKELQAKK